MYNSIACQVCDLLEYSYKINKLSWKIDVTELKMAEEWFSNVI